MNNSRALGVAMAIAGILLFSSKAVLVKLAYRYEIDSVTLLLLRMGFSLPFYLIVALLKRPEQKPEKRDIIWLFVLGVIGYYLSSYFDFKGLLYVKASLERLILFIYPTLVLLITFLIFKKRITRSQTYGVIITYLGVLMIFYSELAINRDSHVVLGSALIFLSALTYAGYLVGSGWIIPRFGPTLFTSYAMIISCTAVIINYLIAGSGDALRLPSEVYVIGFCMALFATVIPSYLISYAIKILGASNFSIFGSLGPVSTITLAYIFLGETLTFIQIAGGVVIVCGIFIAEKKIQEKNIR